MRFAKVTYSTGDVIGTSINGTDETIRNYFAIGKVFNLGSGERDKMAKVVKVEIVL